MSARQAVYDALVNHWLDNTEAGQAMMQDLGLTRDAARREIHRLRAEGLVSIEVGEPDAAGRFSLQIEAVPVPANDVHQMNRHERRAAARRARA